MIFLAIMLFMIGQALNMGTSYWVIWGIYVFCQVLFGMIKVLKNLSDEFKEEN